MNATCDLIEDIREVLFASLGKFAVQLRLFDNFGKRRRTELESDVQEVGCLLLGIVSND